MSRSYVQYMVVYNTIPFQSLLSVQVLALESCTITWPTPNTINRDMVAPGRQPGDPPPLSEQLLRTSPIQE